MISRGEHDPSVERPEVEEDKTVMTLHKDQKRRAERENKDKRTRYSDNRDTDNENNGDISMHHHSDKSKSAQKVDDFGGNSNMVSHDDKDALKREWVVPYYLEFPHFYGLTSLNCILLHIILFVQHVFVVFLFRN